MKKIAQLSIVAIGFMCTTNTLKADGDSINITNQTEREDITEIATILAEDIFEFDTLNLIIRPLQRSIGSVYGAVQKDVSRDHTYLMLIKESISSKQLMLVMSHEFVHIHQYEFGGLELFGDLWAYNPNDLPDEQGVTWGSLTYTKYSDRPYEQDAIKREIKVNKQLRRIIKTQNHDDKQ